MSNEKSENPADAESSKTLVSFYLKNTQVDQIEDAIFHIKKQLPMAKRRKMTKSVLYALGVQIALEEYNSVGKESPLWKAIYELMQD